MQGHLKTIGLKLIDNNNPVNFWEIASFISEFALT